MELYRKYYHDNDLKSILEGQPDWGVTVKTIGHNVHRPNSQYPDSKHPHSYKFNWQKGRILDEFQLVYISHGHGSFEAEGVVESRVESGTAFLLFPGIWHRYKPSDETGWEEFWVGFKGPYADYLMKQDCFMSTSPFINIGFDSELLNVFTKLIDTVKYEGIAYYQLSSCLITQLLALVYSSAIITNPLKENKYKLIHMARYKMHESIDQNIDMEVLARDLNVSYSWFRKVFKETLGSSPGQYHLTIRIEKACRLLRETDLTVSQITYHLGFQSEFYFSRIFKKKVGVPPGQYRKDSSNEGVKLDSTPILPLAVGVNQK